MTNKSAEIQTPDPMLGRATQKATVPREVHMAPGQPSNQKGLPGTGLCWLPLSMKYSSSAGLNGHKALGVTSTETEPSGGRAGCSRPKPFSLQSSYWAVPSGIGVFSKSHLGVQFYLPDLELGEKDRRYAWFICL